MSTNCIIAKKEKDNSIKAIQCNYDGYPRYVGKKLLTCYNNEGIVDELISLGNLCSIGDDLGYHGNVTDTEAYIRDQGEDVESNTYILYKSEDELLNRENIYACYLYLFKDGQWYFSVVKDWIGPVTSLELLTEEIVNKD